MGKKKDDLRDDACVVAPSPSLFFREQQRQQLQIALLVQSILSDFISKFLFIEKYIHGFLLINFLLIWRAGTTSMRFLFRKNMIKKKEN